MMGGAVWLIIRVMSPEMYEELGMPAFAKGIMTEKMLYVYNGMYKLIIPDYVHNMSGFYLDPETRLDEIIFLCNTKRLNFCYSFESMENLKEVHILGNIEEIGAHGFEDCENLEKVTFPDTLKRIESDAFAGCRRLNNIRFNDGLEFIGTGAFCSCDSIEEIIFPSNKVTVSGDAFNFCPSVKRAEINAAILEAPLTCSDDYIGAKEALCCLLVMSSCDDLESLSYRGTENIVRFCDIDMPALKEVTIGEGARVICTEAFSEAYKLEEIAIPEGVEEIMEKAFANCPVLKTVILPDSMRRIAQNAFENSPNVQVGYKGKIYSYNELDRLFA